MGRIFQKPSKVQILLSNEYDTSGGTPIVKCGDILQGIVEISNPGTDFDVNICFDGIE